MNGKNFTIKKIKKRYDIQTLRGLAVLFIVLYHFSPEVFPNGYLGVDIFFIISGFTISNLLYSKLAINDLNILEFFKKAIFLEFFSIFNIFCNIYINFGILSTRSSIYLSNISC